MPFYQMLCIASHYSDYKHIKNLVTTSARHVMDAGGVVRNLGYQGHRTLPQRMKRNKQIYSAGDYWTMDFDASPNTQQALASLMRHDPRVIRYSILKLGERAEEVATTPEKTTFR
ncbi:hypothetical protein CONPUDRAFT_19434, partial [Coniophora puteana RWD-64-598 SS2]